MSNWIENSPVRSLIVHTIVVFVATWGAFVYFFDEKKVNGYRAQAETEKATAGQFKAKTEVLEVEISRLKDENKKYLDWLTASPQTIPYFENKLKALTAENTTLKLELTTAEILATDNPFTNLDSKSFSYVATKTLSLGEAYVDPRTNATIGIGRITPEFTAKGSVTLPGQDQRNFDSIQAGDNWVFTVEKTQFQLSVLKVDWFSNKAEVMIKEIDAQK